jgi:hypothetical protein
MAGTTLAKGVSNTEQTRAGCPVIIIEQYVLLRVFL